LKPLYLIILITALFSWLHCEQADSLNLTSDVIHLFKSEIKDSIITGDFLETFKSDPRVRGWQCSDYSRLRFAVDGVLLNECNITDPCSISVKFHCDKAKTLQFQVRKSEEKELKLTLILDGIEYDFNNNLVSKLYANSRDTTIYEFKIEQGTHSAVFLLKSKNSWLRWVNLSNYDPPVIELKEDFRYVGKKILSIRHNVYNDSIFYYGDEGESIYNLVYFKKPYLISPYNLNPPYVYGREKIIYSMIRNNGVYGRIEPYKIKNYEVKYPYTSKTLSFLSIFAGLNQTNSSSGLLSQVSFISFGINSEYRYLFEENIYKGSVAGSFHLSGTTLMFIQLIGLHGKQVDRPLFIIPGILTLPFITSQIGYGHKFSGEYFYRWQTDLPLSELSDIFIENGYFLFNSPYMINFFFRYEKEIEGGEETKFGLEFAYIFVNKYDRNKIHF